MPLDQTNYGEEIPVHAQRLYTLADVIENLETKQINMDLFLERNEKGCLSAGCVLGWAAVTPEFNEQGLVAVWSKKYPKQPDIILNKGKRGEEWNDDAGEKFFGISFRAFDTWEHAQEYYGYTMEDPLPVRCEKIVTKLRKEADKKVALHLKKKEKVYAS